MEIWPALIHLGYLQQYVNVHAEVATPPPKTRMRDRKKCSRPAARACRLAEEKVAGECATESDPLEA
jgi:hypothetical protein